MHMAQAWLYMKKNLGLQAKYKSPPPHLEQSDMGGGDLDDDNTTPQWHWTQLHDEKRGRWWRDVAAPALIISSTSRLRCMTTSLERKWILTAAVLRHSSGGEEMRHRHGGQYWESGAMGDKVEVVITVTCHHERTNKPQKDIELRQWKAAPFYDCQKSQGIGFWFLY